MSGTLQSGLWFVGVGSAAALTHLLVFSLTQPYVWPELANAAGFMVAFFISFGGHRLLSFRDSTTPVTQSLQRFVFTALAGFATNEGGFSLLLRWAGWPALAALVAAQVVAAGQTFLLSRFWAFRR